MDELFQLTAPEELQAWLRTFDEPERRSGHSLFTGGHVDDFEHDPATHLFWANVRDNGALVVTSLRKADENGWSAECDCGAEHCEHVFALASAVLAEHRAGLVRRLSGSLVQRLAEDGRAEAPRPTLAHQSLEKDLAAATGRPLTEKESQFLRQLHKCYAESCRTRQLATWSLHSMGLPVGDVRTYHPEPIWPSFPENELEFWLYIALDLKSRNIGFPRFMKPITRLEEVEGRMNAWRRGQEIEQWKSTLAKVPPALPATGAGTDEGETDLRIRLTVDSLTLQYGWPGKPDYTDFNTRSFSAFEVKCHQGATRLSVEAQTLWHLFHQLSYDPKLPLRHWEPRQHQVFSNLLRMRMLEDRIVSESGQPLLRPAEPLRWAVTAPDNEAGDYYIRLVRADGSPAPEVVKVVQGFPYSYLTLDAVFTGPAPPAFMGKVLEANIPAAAMESSSGVGFLQNLGVELPARLRDRVRTVPMQVHLNCELSQSEFGPEECLFSVRAEAEDGQQETWDGYEWRRSARRRRGKTDDQAITVYDRSSLAGALAWMVPLNIKVGYDHRLSIRVTRKFPELFAGWLRSAPPYVTVHLEGELASFMSGDIAGSVRLDVAEAEIDWFDLRVVLNVQDTTLTDEEIQLLLKAKGRYVRLEGKGWRRLQFDLDEEDDERLARLGLSPHELSAEPQRMHALQLADPAARKFLPDNQVEQIQRRVDEIRTRVAPDVPAGVTAQFRPYQVEGYQFLAYLSSNRFGGILADDMGLGKTVQTLAWLLWLREQKPDAAASGHPPSLVVCPKSVMDNWHAEAAKFTPGLRVRCWSSADLPQLSRELGSADLHVLNYSQLRNVGEALGPARWLAVILDEGQYIKNPSSQTAKVARSLRAAHRLILTGTPIENRLLDLWSLMSFSMPGVLGNRAGFGRLYDAKDDPFARRRLAARVRPFVLRRTKSQVAKDLPDRIEEDLFCEIEGEQQTLYRAELKRAQAMLLRISTQAELARQQFNFLTSLLRLRQICCHPGLLNPESKASSAKMEALIDQLEPLMEEGEKVLVFSQFVGMLELLRPALEERAWPVYYLVGQTENRGELVRKFQEAPGAAVFLISLKAGGFGLNLTAANYVVLFDPWWNPAVESQAIDRTHRIGQTEKVIAYRLLIKNSIEEKIRELQRKKKALAEDVLGEEKFSQSLTLDDLKFLFAD